MFQEATKEKRNCFQGANQTYETLIGEMNGRIPAGFGGARVWLLLRMQQGGLVRLPGRWRCLPLPHSEEVHLSLCGENE